MTVQGEIYDALLRTDAMAGGRGSRLYAIEAGMQICAIPATWHARMDSAELVDFIHNAIEKDVLRGYDQYAAAIVTRFNLEGHSR